MNTECFRVHIPPGRKVTGTTANGVPAEVLPGEYLVHRLRSEIDLVDPGLLRFVGADGAGRDVHVRATSLGRLTATSNLPGELSLRRPKL